MKSLLISLSLLMFSCTSQLQQQSSFDYAQAWEQVYQLELRGLPKSASIKVDSIYAAAALSAAQAPQRVKAVIYQSKFLLLLEEDAQQQVIDRLKAEIEISPKPVSNILESVLAGFYTDYLEQNEYTISRRSTIVTPDESFLTWDEQTFLTKISQHFESSLLLSNSQLKAKSSIFDDILLVDSAARKFRPLLFDLLAHRAIEFWSKNETKRKTQNRFRILDTNLLSDDKSFANLLLDQPDTSSFLLKSLRVYQRLTTLHQSDSSNLAKVDVAISRRKFVYRNSNFDSPYFKSLELLSKEYEADVPFARVNFEMANYLNKQANKYSPGKNEDFQFKKAKAKHVCDSVLMRFPNSFGANQCRVLVQNITTPELSIAVEKYLLPEKPSKIQVNYRNHENLYLSTYRVLFDGEHSIKVPLLDSLRSPYFDSLELEQQWTVYVKNEVDYQKHLTEVVFPAHDKGQYLLVLHDSNNSYLTSRVIQVTNLALIPHENGNNNSYRVINRMNGLPYSGVKVVLTEREWNIGEPLSRTLESDHEGVIRLPEVKNGFQFDLELRQGEDIAFFDENYGYSSRSAPSRKELESRVFMFTDRKIYRPGHHVFFKVILSKDSTQNSEVFPDQEITILLRDANDNAIDSLTTVTNEFGSISSDFMLPKNALSGLYSLIAVKRSLAGEKVILPERQHFSVEEYKAPGFEIVLDLVKQAHVIGDSVRFSGVARSFTGSVLTDATVSYKISRYLSTSNGPYFERPRHIREKQLIVLGNTETTKDGSILIDFLATPDLSVSASDMPVYQYIITVDVTDLNGETRSKTKGITIGYDAYRLGITADDMDVQNGSGSVWVMANSFNNVPQQIDGELELYKLMAPDFAKREFMWKVPDYPGFTKDEHDSLFSEYPYQYEADPDNWPLGKLALSKKVTTNPVEPQMIRDISDWPPGYYRAVFVSKAGQKTSQTFRIRDSKGFRVADKQLFQLDIDKSEYFVGDTIRVSYGTAVEEMYVTIWVEKKTKGITGKFTTRLSKEVKELAIPVRPGDEEGIGIYYYYVYQNFFEADRVKAEVSLSTEQLKLETATFRNRLEPGRSQVWSFSIKGKKADKLNAEILASMYDASMHEIAPNDWSFNPLKKNPFFPYNKTNSTMGFSIGRAGSSGYETGSRIPYPIYDRFNWFGMSFNYFQRSQETYLHNLKWRKSPKPYFFSTLTDQLSGMIKGRIMDEQGFPMSNVWVFLPDVDKRILTDSTGAFELNATGSELLEISFWDYRNFYLNLGEHNYFEIFMAPDGTVASKLQRLIGMSTGKSYSLSFANRESLNQQPYYGLESAVTRSDRDMLQTELESYTRGEMDNKGISTMAFRSNSDYRPVRGDMANFEDLNPGNRISTKPATEASIEQQASLLANVKTRTNLKETAFFFPQLKTNAQGEVSFEFDSPESLSRWNLQLLAHNKELASDILRRTVVTQKELMIVPNPPRFFREGDTITFSAKLASLNTAEMKGSARLELYDEVTGKLLEEVITGSGNRSFQLAARGNTSLSWQLSIPEGVQAIRYKIVAATNDFSDGEENVLPVLSNRMLVQESVPLWARANSTKTFSLDKLKTQQSNSLKHHKLTLTMTINPVWEAIQNLPYLMEYPYECAEQTFARYYANRLGSYLVEGFPVIKSTFEQWAASGASVSRLEQNQELKALMIEETPWLREAKNKTEQQKRLAMLFESAHMKEQLDSSLDKLRKMQLSSGGFPWFSGSDRPNLYITQHIIAGLAHLQKLTGASEFQDIIAKGQSYMDKELIRQYKELSNQAGFIQTDEHISFFQVQYLYTRSLTNAESASEELAEAIGFFKKQAFDHWLQMDLQSQAMIAIYAKKTGDDDKAMQIIASLREYSITDEEKGIYWKNNVTGWYNWEAPIETQALLIEAFYEITDDQAYHDGMRQWLLAEKRTKSWKSTKATTEAIYALLHGSLGMLSPNNSVSVSLGAEPVIMDTTGEETMGAGYFKKTWQAAEIKPEMAEVVIENGGNTVAFGGLHWQYFEDLDKITPAMGPLSLEKKLFLVANDASGEVLKEMDENTALALGDLVRVRIVLRSDRSMEFLHLKDMRAAGFEPLNVLSGYRWQDGLGYYESTRDAATNFFIEYLPKGTFVFEYDLRVNNEGNFSNGITSIQNMYAPEFSSHSEGVRVLVGKDK